jgi:large subunit ribosomal protein L23
MAHLSIYKVIKGSHISSKAISLNSQNKLTLIVDVNSTKKDIKLALKYFFNVDAIKINVVIVKGKNKKFASRYTYTTQDYKKAIITLKDGQQLNDLGSVPEQDVIERINNTQAGV